MGHHISAVLLHGPFDEQRGRSFGLTSIPLVQGIAGQCDDLSELLDIAGSVSDRPLLNCRVVHHLMRLIAPEPLFAVIETDYFGGLGDQAAAVYRGDTEVMAPAIGAIGPNNQALRHLGVRGTEGMDEFDTVGLGPLRYVD
jgi:hypothetical protein